MIKWIGGLYLIYLGFCMIRDARQPTTTEMRTEDVTKSWRSLFASAFIVTALNPKSIIFFIALLPQFVSPDQPAAPQLWILGITFVIMAMTGGTIYALFARSIRGFLTSSRAHKIYSYSGGGLLGGAGVWALSAQRAMVES